MGGQWRRVWTVWVVEELVDGVWWAPVGGFPSRSGARSFRKELKEAKELRETGDKAKTRVVCYVPRGGE